jgi:hypothetical protein
VHDAGVGATRARVVFLRFPAAPGESGSPRVGRLAGALAHPVLQHDRRLEKAEARLLGREAPFGAPDGGREDLVEPPDLGAERLGVVARGR